MTLSDHVLDTAQNQNLTEAIKSDMKPSKIPEYDIERLVLWTRKQLNLYPDLKLILFVPDFESLDFGFLSTIISIFGYILNNERARMHELPIVFLFGVSYVDTIHQSLPAQCISLMKMRKFQLKSSTKCINYLISEV